MCSQSSCDGFVNWSFVEATGPLIVVSKYGCPFSWKFARSVGTLDGCCVFAKIVMWSFWTSAIAHVGPIEKTRKNRLGFRPFQIEC